MTAPEQEVVAGLAEIVEEVTGLERADFTLNKSFVDDLDVDSVYMVEIAVQTEEKYGIEIPDDRLKSLRTVRDVVNLVIRRNPPVAD